MRKISRLKIYSGYSIAEILITLFIISLVVLLSTSALKHKYKNDHKKDAFTHGLYACTVFDGAEYYIVSNKKDLKIPYGKESWTKGKCGTAFVMPEKAGLLNVKIMGAGGAGGSASLDWEDSVSPQVFYNSSSYKINQAGYYDIVVSGNSGTYSSVSSWVLPTSGYNCFVPNAPAGLPMHFSGTIYLNKNDLIDILFDAAYAESLNLSCSSKIDTPNSQAGMNSSDIIINRNNSKILSVNGSKAGTYLCMQDSLCSGHYEPITGNDGSATTYAGFSNQTKIINNGIYEPGSVLIKWSDSNFSSKSFSVKPGCGGTSGEIKAALYPILNNKLPKILLNGGGSPGNEPEASSFGSMRAEAGKNNKICSPDKTVLNGMDGMDFSVLENLKTLGGQGGVSAPTAVINGGSATGFASGGGGGAIYYSTLPSYDNSKTAEENKKAYLDGVHRWYEGTGGSGGSGLLIITW